MPEQFPNSAPEGIHPESGLYHVDHMPLPNDPARRAVIEKQLAGEQLSLGEMMQAGRDQTYNSLGGIEVKPDHVYRSVGSAGLHSYQEAGAVVGQNGDREFEPGNNNSGIDWYLGGIAPKYGNGEVILEAPALPDYFEPSTHLGTGMAKDPKVRHFKSSPHAAPVPITYVNAYRKNTAGGYDRISQ